MSQIVAIRDVHKHVGESVTIRGWIYNLRSSGKLRFLILRDGSGYLQALVAKQDATEETFESSGTLTQESSLTVTGTLRKDERAPGGFELGVESIEIIQVAERASLEDTDLIAAAAELAQRENIYRASLAVTARVLQPSLLDFLG